MKHLIARWSAAAVALTSVTAAVPAHAADLPQQRLNATAYYATLDLAARQTHGLKAKFVTVHGEPAPGLPIRFVSTGERAFLCEATTDRNGYAECVNGPLPPPVSLVKLLLAGYDATFDGNRWLAPVSAHNSVGVA